jgi:hypothetical protein
VPSRRMHRIDPRGVQVNPPKVRSSVDVTARDWSDEPYNFIPQPLPDIFEPIVVLDPAHTDAESDRTSSLESLNAMTSVEPAAGAAGAEADTNASRGGEAAGDDSEGDLGGQKPETASSDGTEDTRGPLQASSLDLRQPHASRESGGGADPEDRGPVRPDPVGTHHASDQPSPHTEPVPSSAVEAQSSVGMTSLASGEGSEWGWGEDPSQPQYSEGNGLIVEVPDQHEGIERQPPLDDDSASAAAESPTVDRVDHAEHDVSDKSAI